MKNFESVIRFRCECGRVIEESFPAFDMVEMLQKSDAHSYENVEMQVVCECGKYFDGFVEASLYVGDVE